ncbi:ComEC/Rec2 family competence protein [Diaminobutyricimonas sp. LJ205]|uniref:ComEC/Rec2 family competence protein n=1 Tax=Diaminobutyricimonas sp. LJ205 TaxID=2683590 RepID=UPI0012F49BF5|nr:ComEC/Rec2 family competence protein [Diaminobutyricimonas sp. LJ205]
MLTNSARLAIPALVAWIAAAIVIALPSAVPFAIGLWLAALVSIGIGWRARISSALLVGTCAAAAAVVASVAAGQQPIRQPAAVVALAEEQSSITGTAQVTRIAAEERFEALLLTIDHDERVLAVRIPALLFASAPVAPGGVISWTGSIQPTPPGDDVAFLVFPDDTRSSRQPSGVLAGTAELRAGFLELTGGLPGNGADLLPGLAIGDTSAVSAELDQAMKTSALSHLTAVSGANCAVVIGLVMLAGAALGLPRGWRVGASVVLLVGFVLLVTPEPSVLRAAVMAGIVLITLAIGRPVRGLPVLALAVLVLLVADPWLALDYGFVLSVLATGGLLLFSGPLTGVLARWLPRPLATVTAVPLAAQLACQPVLITLDASIPVHGVAANLLAAPAAPVATILGSLACVLAPVLPPVAHLLAVLAWLPASWIATLAEVSSALPGARLPWPDGLVGVILCALISAGVIVAARLRPGFGRRLAATVTAGLLVLTVGGMAGSQVVQRLGRPADWQVAMCDVGQGDAALLRSAGMTMLIDAGPDEQLLTDCLDALGIGRIDVFVATHFDLDHVGGVGAVLGRASVVLTGPPATGDDERVLERLAASGADIIDARAGLSGLLGELRWRVLWPPSRGEYEGNDGSVVITAEGVGACANGCPSALFLGDLGEQTQSAMLAGGAVPEVDVVKVAHHGSADQSRNLYERAAATVGLIGVGADNGYGHPTASILSDLERLGTTVVRTDRAGLVLLSSGGSAGAIEVWTQRGGGASR